MSNMAGAPCPAVARAILGAVDAPDGVLLRCGLIEGHTGRHIFHMEWTDPPETGLSGAELQVADEVEGYLAHLRRDPDFRRRLAQRIEEDAKILRRLAQEDGPAPGLRSRLERAMRPRLHGTERQW